MSAVEQAQASGGLFGFLDRNRTIAEPGFSRWMVPPAALCIHLCIGQAYAFSVFNLPMTKLLGITQSAPGDWNLPELGWIFSIGDFRARLLCRDFRPLGRGGRPAPGDVHRRSVLGRGFLHRGVRRLHPQSLDRLFWLRPRRRLRTGHRLHFPGLNPDQMVPRPAGNGDRHGYHGLRRWRLYRLAALGLADEQLPDRAPHRRRPDLHGHGRDLLRLHDGRRVHRAGAGAGLETRRLYPAGAGVQADHHQRRVSSTTH